MAEFAEQARIFLEQIIARLGYGGIVLATILETVFPPLPSDLVVPAAGLLAARGEMHIAGIVIAATFGSLMGALVLYAVGRRAGEPLTRKFIRRYGRWLLLRETDLDKVERLFNRYGKAIILFGHLIPGVRSLVSLPAGMSRMPLPHFALFTMLGAGARVTLQTVTGALLGHHWPRLILVIEEFEWLVYLLIAAAVAAGLMKIVWAMHSRLANTKTVEVD
ncbi:MAG TPA: DedA family protein [Anaerolineales bacterium]|nr:DedA family protein [Anaerolineales bacterium]